ncbi:MAG: WG repeat-containing protein [Bacteroidales bacterium]|jgi:hypothetical protein|nr:WG repeat-containing protein [Bacteroidales bacterium]
MKMKALTVFLVIAFMAIGSYATGQGLEPKECANGKYGYVDKTGKEVIPCKYDEVGFFSEGFALVRISGKYGYVDRTGKEIVPCQYDEIGIFSEGIVPVTLKGKKFYIDKTGKCVKDCP